MVFHSAVAPSSRAFSTASCLEGNILLPCSPFSPPFPSRRVNYALPCLRRLRRFAFAPEPEAPVLVDFELVLFKGMHGFHLFFPLRWWVMGNFSFRFFRDLLRVDSGREQSSARIVHSRYFYEPLSQFRLPHFRRPPARSFTNLTSLPPPLPFCFFHDFFCVINV